MNSLQTETTQAYRFTVEVLNVLGQLSVHFFDHLGWTSPPTVLAEKIAAFTNIQVFPQ